MTPKNLHAAVEATRNAASVASRMQSPLQAALTDGEFILREAAIFADAIADGIDQNEAATRLLSAVLGFEFRTTGTSVPYAMSEAYKRSPRA